MLEYFAEVTDAVYLESWAQVARLDGDHFWNEALLRERFDYHDRPGMTPGLHLLIVRVSRVNLPHRLAPSPAYEGCKSWIEVPGRLDPGHRDARGAAGGIRHAPQPHPRRRLGRPDRRHRMSALVLLAPGFEEIEAITVIDILRRAEIETVVAGLTTNPLVASRKTRHLADVHLADVDTSPVRESSCCPAESRARRTSPPASLVRDWLFRQRERDQWVAALCAAPTALLAHGWLGTGSRLTAHPDRAGAVSRVKFKPGKRVVVDGKSHHQPGRRQRAWNSPSRSCGNCAGPKRWARSTRASVRSLPDPILIA